MIDFPSDYSSNIFRRFFIPSAQRTGSSRKIRYDFGPGSVSHKGRVPVELNSPAFRRRRSCRRPAIFSMHKRELSGIGRRRKRDALIDSQRVVWMIESVVNRSIATPFCLFLNFFLKKHFFHELFYLWIISFKIYYHVYCIKPTNSALFINFLFINCLFWFWSIATN